MIAPSEQRIRAEKLAREILVFSRDLLLTNMRFLDAAIHQLPFQSTEDTATLATDGSHFLYNPVHVLRSYRDHKERPVRDFLHALHHCLFHHLFINPSINRPIWNLACDVAAEHAIDGLGLGIAANPRQPSQAGTLAKLKAQLKLITAETIYRYFINQKLNDQQLADLQAAFYADDHSIWYPPPDQDGEGDKQTGADLRDGSHMAKGDSETQGDPAALQALWKQIAERVQVDIETASRQWGDKAGGLYQSLNQVNREKYDYAAFLQRFAVLGEVMQVNPDEFDLVFYTYGLQMYRNMPLIEPLEVREVKRVREFVIAIDTSGSVQGAVVQAFIQKTYNILKQSENFFSRVNIHIVQCDVEVQEDHKITSIEEFEKYMKTMTLRGFGGTDFRPVFHYVDELLHNREFENLKGLIYFTDGYGFYPEKKPRYDAAFVFVDEDYIDTPAVPSWAIKLVLSTDDILDGRKSVS